MQDSQKSLEELRQEVTTLHQQLADLQERLNVTEETLQAIGAGEVDAFVVSTEQGMRVFTIQGADHIYQCLVEQMGEGAATISAEGIILYCNQRLADLLDCSLNHLIGYQLETFIAHKDSQAFLQLLQEISERETLTRELSLRKAKGNKEVPVKLSLKQLQINDSLVNSVIVTDITESKVKESAKLSQILSSAIAVIKNFRIFRDRTIVIDSWMGGTEQVFGYSLEEVNADSDLVIANIFPEDREKFLNFFLADLQSENVGVCEYRFIHKDGTIHWLNCNYLAEWDQAQNCWMGINIITDITARKRSEIALKQEEEKLSLFVRFAPVSMAMFDLNMCYLTVSQRWLDMYQLGSRESIIGRSHYDVFPNIPDSWKKIHQECLAGETRKCDQDSFILADGSMQWLKWEVLPWRTSTNKVGGILIFVEDITEMKQLEKQFYHAQRLESLGTLASGIAHDFNNILTPILGITQLLPLEFPDLDESTATMLKLLSNSANRGVDLIKQIMLFSRSTEGKSVTLQIGYLLLELIGITKKTFPKSITISANIPTLELWTIEADAIQIHQVFMNLMVNARDAMADGGNLKVSAENCHLDEQDAQMYLDAKAGDYVVVTVADQGSGISPEVLNRIFDPFFTTKEVGKGTGLGLSTVAGIIKNHGGFIKVYSVLGKGTEFKVFFPATKGEVNLTHLEEVMPNGKGELILIVDDEESIREVTKISLENYNYKTILASDGVEAIALYSRYQQEISVVIMDMTMPNLDGATTISTLRNLNPSAKIIATSGLADNHKFIIDNDVQTFLLKPYTISQLLQALTQILLPLELRASHIPTNTAEMRELSKKDLAIMSPAWLKQMYDAAYYCDDEVMLELVSQIPPSQQAIANALRCLVLDFKTDFIMKLTK